MKSDLDFIQELIALDVVMPLNTLSHTHSYTRKKSKQEHVMFMTVLQQ